MAVDATREALTIGARHSSAHLVNLYSEVKDDRDHVFVRDRGAGFDPAAVEEGRGIRPSLRQKMLDSSGSFTVTSLAGEATEVEISSGSVS